MTTDTRDPIAEEIGEGTMHHAYRQKRAVQRVVTLQPGQSWPDSESRANLPPFRWVADENRGVAGSGNDVWVTYDPYNVNGKADLIAPAGAAMAHNVAGKDEPALHSAHFTNVGATAIDALIVLDLEPIVMQRQALYPGAGGGGGGGAVQITNTVTGIADGVAGANILELGIATYNGATWDRLHSNNGALLIGDAQSARNALNVAAAGNTAAVATSNMDGALVTVNTTGYTGGNFSYVFEFSDDGGVTWFPTQGIRTDATAILGGDTINGGGTLRAYSVDAPGATNVRLRVTAFTAGGTAPAVGITATSATLAPNTMGAILTRNDGVQIGLNGWTLGLLDGITPSLAMYTSTLNFGYVGNAQSNALRTPFVFKSAAVSAAGNTALWTPASGKKFRLMRYCIQASLAATLAVAGDEVVGLQDSTTDLGLSVDFRLLTAGQQGMAFQGPWTDLGNGILSSAANNVLNVNLGTALSGGVIRVLACGTEE